jgi:hypothetical protein
MSTEAILQLMTNFCPYLGDLRLNKRPENQESVMIFSACFPRFGQANAAIVIQKPSFFLFLYICNNV